MTVGVIYTRQSLDASGDALGVARQREQCEALAQSRGITVSKVISDNNRSASVGKRPGYDQLIDLIKSGDIKVVITWRMDRLLRKLTELEELITLCEQTGVQVMTVQGDLDLTNSTGRLVGRILASVARSEVETKSERHRLANEQKAKAGKPHASRRPYGYEPGYKAIRESEASVLREMARQVISGSSFKEVAWWLNEQGHTTTLGRPWYPLTVRNMLNKERYAGKRTYKGAIYDAEWQPIFDAETWELLQHTLRMRREKNGDRPVARKYLLTGFVFCGKCGAALNGATKRDHPDRPIRRTYHCRVQGDAQRKGGCGGVVRGAEPLEHLVREAICYRLDSTELERLLHSDSNVGMYDLLAEREALKARLDSLTDDYADGTLDKAAYKRATDRVRARLSDVEREIEQLHHASLNVSLKAGQTVREAWTENSDGWKRQLIGLLIDRIELKPGTSKPFYYVDDVRYRFDPDLVSVIWRA